MTSKAHNPRPRQALKAVVFSVLMTASAQVHAEGIAADLMKFFNSAGMESNVTSPGAHKDQTAGYYSGGGVTARTGARNAQLATVQMPGFRAGCGGIDLWMGGFSHISSGAIVEMLRNIGSSAASYAFMLAVQTVSPQIYNIMNELNALANQVNQTNVNSCEAAATLLGGAWPKSDQTSKHLCQAMGSNLGAFSDWSAARQGCGAKGDRANVLSKAASDPKYKDMLVGEINLAWKAIQQNAFLNKDSQLAQLFMSLVGSIISRADGESFRAYRLPALVHKTDQADGVMNGLMNGGQTAIYACDDLKNCLNPTLKNTNIPADSGLYARTSKLIDELIRKAKQDDGSAELSSEEKSFLNSTRLPIYKMINVITAFSGGQSPLDINHYAELIAIDILHQYVTEIIDIVFESVVNLKAVQVREDDIKDFLEELRYARERINAKRKSAYQQMDSALMMIQSTQLIEKQLHVMMGGMANENNWT